MIELLIAEFEEYVRNSKKQVEKNREDLSKSLFGYGFDLGFSVGMDFALKVAQKFE